MKAFSQSIRKGCLIGIYIWANASIKRKHIGVWGVDVLRNNRILRLLFRKGNRGDRAADVAKIRCATGKLWLGTFCLFLYREKGT